MSMLTRKIRDYVSRIGHMRGFGIQSPRAYAFVREVIAESLPYYAYDVIDAMNEGRRKKQFMRLYVRIANRRQPQAYCDLTGENLYAVVNRGCHLMKEVHSLDDLQGSIHLMCRLTLGQATPEMVSRIMQSANKESVLIVEQLGLTDEQQRQWEQLKQHPLVGVTFDLGPTAIVFTDTSMHKDHYKLNF